MQEAHLNKLDNCTEDDFEKLKLVSNGAYCAVHLIKHKLSGVPYAMKVFQKNKLTEKSKIKKVLCEQSILKSMDNPFIVGLVCSFQTEKHLCMVMEYVPGGDVAALIKKVGPLSKDLSKTYIAETTLAIEYLHSFSVLHRDLKPDNLLITFSGHIKLADFGLSQMLPSDGKDLKYDKDLYFKPQYIAPEYLLQYDYGKPVDWWSMGILLYEFLTSRPPFGGKTIQKIFHNVLISEIKWPKNDNKLDKIPEEAKNLVISLLNRNPSKRLGARGAIEIKEHPFFNLLEWDRLLDSKPEFVPELKGPYDTEYFDSRSDVHNHDSTSPTITKLNDIQKKYFAKFTSCSSKFNLNDSSLHEDESLQSALKKHERAVSQSPEKDRFGFKSFSIDFPQIHDDDILKQDSNKPLDGVSQITESDKFKQDSKNNPFAFSRLNNDENLKKDSNKGYFIYQKKNENLKIKRSKEDLNKLMDKEELIIAKKEILGAKVGNISNSDITKLELNFNFSLSF